MRVEPATDSAGGEYTVPGIGRLQIGAASYVDVLGERLIPTRYRGVQDLAFMSSEDEPIAWFAGGAGLAGATGRGRGRTPRDAEDSTDDQHARERACTDTTIPARARAHARAGGAYSLERHPGRSARGAVCQGRSTSDPPAPRL